MVISIIYTIIRAYTASDNIVPCAEIVWLHETSVIYHHQQVVRTAFSIIIISGAL